MRPVSDAFLRTLRGSHRMFARAKVLTTFQSGIAPTGTEIPIVDGDVRADASADVRASLDLTTSGDGTWPQQPGDLLAPYGNELFVERGINYGNGTIEIVSLGYFRINSTSQESGPRGEIKISASDRMSGIVDGRLPFPVQFAAGTSVLDAFTQLITEVYPDATIEFDFDGASSMFAEAHIAEEDRYGFLRDVAQSRGKIMYWDYRGVLKVVSPPDPTVPVYEINSGAGGVMVSLSRTLTRQSVYNGVVATGESTGDIPPVTALVFDSNPNSPTYWNGRFGRVPRFYYSSFITTADAATSAATSILQRAIGLPYNIDLNAVPNPALEPYDPITITAPDTIDLHVIDSITIPLTASGTMTGSTRKLLSFGDDTV
jgi:hypothetical protein